MHKEAKNNDLFVLGEYHVDNLGRYIYIYYGSFIKIHGLLSVEAFEEKLKSTLVHEFTHHLESLVGERSLEIKDEIYMAKYNLRKENSNQ
ncbi:metallopeptidase family protein [endosymbiont 'TC1' of Trimyema compressum]|uniref:metallopeptidase family protein n=1 Tax=endosymbiont 'TC1' of Trimyema compressum TaxID=243899 RepID=UPI000A537781|nr:metallopeptidase family protein [endosymbiont 'TC1' of Trimyema compressum]